MNSEIAVGDILKYNITWGGTVHHIEVLYVQYTSLGIVRGILVGQNTEVKYGLEWNHSVVKQFIKNGFMFHYKRKK